MHETSHFTRRQALSQMAAGAAALAMTAARVGAAEDIRIIIRADDMGSSHTANVACMRAFRDGIAGSIEVQVPCAWYPEAVMMLRDHPRPDIGVHLTLTAEWDTLKWTPFSASPSLVGDDGYMPPSTEAFLAIDYTMDDVERELRAQIERAVRDIPSVTHLSQHMGTAVATPDLQALVARLSDEYGLPSNVPGMRGMSGFGGVMEPEEKAALLASLLEKLEPGLWLLVEHPGLDTPEMRATGFDGYEEVAKDRNSVTAAFTSDRVKAVIERRGIVLTSYGNELNG